MGLGRRQGSVTSQGCSAWRAARAQIYTENHKCINICGRELLTVNRRTTGHCSPVRGRACLGIRRPSEVQAQERVIARNQDGLGSSSILAASP
jgi:hypothetical protein